MSSTTNSLVSLALLGTPGRAVACPLPELQAEWEKIQQGSEDSEEAFYRLAAMVFAYRRADDDPARRLRTRQRDRHRPRVVLLERGRGNR